jgi:GTP-binding protein
MLVDNVEIVVKAGKGGSGLASFRREKFQPFGGPDGGDGGRGGNVYIEADIDLPDLASFKHKLTYKADNGGAGGKNQMHGLNAADLVIRVPVGTTAYVKRGGELVQRADFTVKGQKVMVAKGGKGGQGNVHYATATRKAPRIFQPGIEGETCTITMEMSLPVDVCIIGYPNSGKSTLLSAISGAKPQVAEYYFTTQEPVLGAVDDGQKKYTWAEIPAIVDGSHAGKGLGNGSLRHISRANVLVYLLDATSPQISENLDCLKKEVEIFKPDFAWKKFVVAVNKIDLMDAPESLHKLTQKLASEGIGIFPVSAREGSGLKELITGVHKLVTEVQLIQMDEPAPEVIFRPRPVDRQG